MSPLAFRALVDFCRGRETVRVPLVQAGMCLRRSQRPELLLSTHSQEPRGPGSLAAIVRKCTETQEPWCKCCFCLSIWGWGEVLLSCCIQFEIIEANTLVPGMWLCRGWAGGDLSSEWHVESLTPFILMSLLLCVNHHWFPSAHQIKPLSWTPQFTGLSFDPPTPPLLTCVKLIQLCLAFCDPMDYSLPGLSVQGIHQARILEWVAMPSSRGSS